MWGGQFAQQPQTLIPGAPQQFGGQPQQYPPPQFSGQLQQQQTLIPVGTQSYGSQYPQPPSQPFPAGWAEQQQAAQRNQAPTMARMKDYIVYVITNHLPSKQLLEVIHPFADRCWIQDIALLDSEMRQPWMNNPPIVVSTSNRMAYVGVDAMKEMQRFYNELKPSGKIQFTPSTRASMTQVSLDDDSFADVSASTPGATICGKPFATIDPRVQGLGARILGDGEKVNSTTMQEYLRLRNETAPRKELVMPLPGPDVLGGAGGGAAFGTRKGESINDLRSAIPQQQQPQLQYSMPYGQAQPTSLIPSQPAPTQQGFGGGGAPYVSVGSQQGFASSDTTGFNF